MSSQDDPEVLEVDSSPRSNVSHSPRPEVRFSSRSRSLSRSPPYSHRTREIRSRSRDSQDYRNSNHRQRSSVPHRGSHYYNRSNSSIDNSIANRENPPPSRCLGIFGLSASTKENEIRENFGRYGHIDEVKLIYDAQTGHSRGFGFVYFENVDDAAEAKVLCNGLLLGGRQIRVDFSVTQRGHTPTPGIYLGRKSHRKSSEDRGGYGRYRDDGNGYNRRRSTDGTSCSERRNGAMRYTRSRSRSSSRKRHYR